MDKLGTKKVDLIAGITITLAALTIAALTFKTNRGYYHDDAYITLRYVYNFLNGNGIVWNIGEYVQGYTNFLFLMCISFMGYLGIDLKLATRMLSFAAYIALLVSVLYFSLNLDRKTDREGNSVHPIRYVALLLVATAAPIIVWCMGGLETVFFTMLCTLGAICFATSILMQTSSRPQSLLLASSILFSFCALTRLDGLLFMGISGLFILLTSGKNTIRNIVIFCIPAVLILVTYFSWAYFYYNDPLPNTFYAKASDFSIEKLWSGMVYVAQYSIKAPFTFVLTLLAMAIFLLRRQRMDSTTVYFLTLGIAYSIYVMSVGGDHMYSYRLLVPVIPLAAIALLLLLERLVAPREYGKTAVIYMTLVILCFSQLLHKTPLNPRKEDGASYVGTKAGKYIAREWPPGSLIALNTAGSTPYYATDNIYIDMLGLNDRHIAKRKIPGNLTDLYWQNVTGHSKGDGAYVLSRKPDYIIVGPAQGSRISDPWFLSDLEMQQDQRFHENYAIREVSIDRDGKPVHDETGRPFTYYQRISRD